MTFDERAAPAENSGEGASKETTSPRSDEAIANERTASLAVQADNNAAEQAEHQQDRQTCITEHMIATDCLAEFDWNHPAIPDGLVQRLVKYEVDKRVSKPDYDLTSKPAVMIRKIAETEWNLLQEATGKEESDQEKLSYKDFYKFLTGSTVDKLKAIQAKADDFPEEAAHVAAFMQVLDLAQTPEDTAIVTAKLNALDLSGGIPDPVLFIQSSILTAPDLSEASKDAIASHFKMPRFKTNTGSQVDKAMDAKNEAGEPLHDEHNPLPIRDGLAAYNKPDGSRVARVEIDGIGSREIPWQRNEKGEVIGLKLSLLKIYAVLEAKGTTDFMGETVDVDTIITGHTDPEKLRKTSQIMEALLGNNAGYDGQIISDEQAEFLNWFSQYTSTKGDALEGDYDKHASVESRTALGFHPNGHGSKLDYDVLRAAGSFAQGQYGSGAPDYFAMQKHLHGLFPNRVPLTKENSESLNA